MRQLGDPYYSYQIEVAIRLAEFVAEEVITAILDRK
ncbi:guanosine-3',5'-bis(diphosphate) 3'-pyrophosphohydrolase [Rickettsia canadensis str. CA410]|uniref:Guanosine-3',5'-bis(Diphosphate) 3'-pyrophosphohydrolase n=1 Tax=Rickettsia canadensis str. CA410 TaxID=1105107 RepID=A0ABM5MR64_RICCA|nr:guanosine-3',5'-bis(diphosphate) 3'-pyrophosphohydrolase [Rickettsia canadensis str. CA410]